MSMSAELMVALKARDDASRVVQQAAGNVDSSAKSIVSNWKAVAAGAGIMGAVVLGAGAFMTSAASDMAEAQNKVNVVFGEGAGAISAFAESSAQSIGLAKTEALAAAGGFGNLFTQLGIGAPVAASMSTQMLTLAADFASFHNADITEVIDAQSAAFRGEFDSLQKFVPTINAAAVAEQAMAMTGKATTAALTEQDKALAVHALMVAGAGVAVGDFANTSTGAANSQRIITAEFANISAQIGGVLLPIIAPLISSFATNLPAAIGILSTFIGILVTGLGSAKSAFDTLVAFGSSIVQFFAANQMATDALIGVLVTLVSMGIASLVMALPGMIASVIASTTAFLAQAAAAAAAAAAVVIAALPFIAFGLALAALVVIGLTVWRNWDELSAKAGELWSAVTSAFASIGETISNVWGAVWSATTSTWDSITSTVRSAVNGIIGALNQMINGWNAMSFTVPEITLPFGGGTWGGWTVGVPNIPNIAMLAQGGHITGSGWAMVGERGPELLNLNRGATVAPLGTGPTIVNHFHIGGNVYGDAEAKRMVAEAWMQAFRAGAFGT